MYMPEEKKAQERQALSKGRVRFGDEESQDESGV